MCAGTLCTDTFFTLIDGKVSNGLGRLDLLHILVVSRARARNYQRI